MFFIDDNAIDFQKVNKIFDDIYVEYNENTISDFKRKLILFLKEKKNEKFDLVSHVFFPDGSSMGIWFNENKDIIFNSYDKLSDIAKKQFNQKTKYNYTDLEKIDLREKAYSYLIRKG